MSRGVLAVLVLVGACASLPLWLAPYPPLQDLAANVELGCQLLRVWREEPAFTDALFVHGQPWANSLVSLVLAALLALSPSLAMAKLLLTGALIAWPLAIAWMLVRARKSPWLALLCVPLAFDLAWSYGFLHFVLAKPLVPLCVGAALWLVEADARRTWLARAALLAGLLVLTFLVHSIAWSVALACVALVLAVHVRRPRDLLWLAVPVLSVLPTAPFFLASRDAGTPGFVTRWRVASDALAQAWGDLGDQHPGAGDATPWLVALVALVALIVRERVQLRAWDRARVALLACGIAGLVVWLKAPPVLPQVSVVSPRLLSLALLFVVVALVPAVLTPRARAGLVAAMACATLLFVVDLSRAYRAFSREDMGDFDALLAEVPEGARVATHYTTPFSPHARHNALWHWGKLACLEHGASTDDMFAYRGTSYVAVRPDARATFVRPPHRLRPDALRTFDALLVAGDARSVRGLEDVLVPVARAGRFALFSIAR